MMITYEPTLAAADGTNEQLAARGEHMLLFSSAAKSSAERMVQLRYTEGSKVPWQVVGQMVGPFVEFDGQIGDCVAFGYYPTAQMLDKIFRCRVGLRAEDGTGAVYSLYCKETDKEVREAAPGQRAGLRLGTGDFAAVEADAAKQLPASGAAGEAAYDAVVKYNAEVSDAAFLRGVTFKDLGGGGGGLSDYVQLSNWLGSHMTAASWHVPHFMRVVRVLRKAVLTKEGIEEADGLDDEGVAAGLLRFLAETRQRADLLVMTRAPATAAAASQLRERVKAWQDGGLGRMKREAELLRVHFAELAPTWAGVAAMLGVDRVGGGMPPDGHDLVVDLARRLEVIKTPDGLALPATMAELHDRVEHLAGLFGARPWSEKTVAERVAHALATQRQAARAEQVRAHGAPHYESPRTDPKAKRPSGTGAVPAHYADAVPEAVGALTYRELKADVMARLATGGKHAAIDALRIAATGVGMTASGGPKARVNVPLIYMFAEGAVRGLDAKLVDPELRELTTAAEECWPQLIGRCVAMQLSTDGKRPPENLVGFAPTEELKVTRGNDWAELDLGRLYRRAAAANDGVLMFKDTHKGLPYASLEDINDALEVAEVFMPLRGYHGTGSRTIPWALAQVMRSWRAHGGPTAAQVVVDKLASEGRDFIVSILRAFGRRHDILMREKMPNADALNMSAPEETVDRWGKHLNKLNGARALHGYVAYGIGGGAAKKPAPTPPTTPTPTPTPTRERKRRQGEDGGGGFGGGCSMALRGSGDDKVVTVSRKGMSDVDYSTALLDAACNDGRACYFGMIAGQLFSDRGVAEFCGQQRGDKTPAKHVGASGACHVFKPGTSLRGCRADPDKREAKGKSRKPRAEGEEAPVGEGEVVQEGEDLQDQEEVGGGGGDAEPPARGGARGGATRGGRGRGAKSARRG